MTKFDNTWFAWKWRIVGALVGLIMAAPMFIMAAKADDITVEMLNKLGKEKYKYGFVSIRFSTLVDVLL